MLISLLAPILTTAVVAFVCLYKTVTGNELGDRYGWLCVASIFASLVPQKLVPFFLSIPARVYSVRIDLYLAETERWIGNPAAAVASLFASHHWLAFLSALAYNSMPLGMILASWAYIKRDEFRRIVALFVVNVISGLPFYFLVPASGPRYVPAFESGLHLINLTAAPNCLPSVHFATTLLIVYLCWQWKWARPLVVFHSVLTALACLGFGEHYLIDLVASFPYAVFVWWLVKKPSRARYPVQKEVKVC